MPVTQILQTRNVTMRYGSHVAVDDISFDVAEGDLLGIVGPNGAGKSTLFRAILGLQPYDGTIELFGYGPDRYGSLIPLVGYVPQRIQFEPNFPATVYDVVSMGIISNKRIARGERLIRQRGYHWNRVYGKIGKTEDKIAEALKMAGLESLRDRRIGELSEGEQQRVFIAKSLVKDPMLLILDEPVTGVDVESQTRFYNVIKRINEENGITMVWSSHDLDAINKYASRVACMNRKLFFHGDKDQFFADEDLLKTYTESTMQMHMHDHRV